MTDDLIFSSLILLVDDEDEACDFYTEKFGFTLISDTNRSDGSRWVTLTPSLQSTVRLVLKRAVSRDQQALVGMQAGDGVVGTLEIGHVNRLRNQLQANGVETGPSPYQPDDRYAFIIADLYGNQWEIVQSLSTPVYNPPEAHLATIA